jgi:nucleoside-diphosphate-sugar epimerase
LEHLVILEARFDRNFADASRIVECFGCSPPETRRGLPIKEEELSTVLVTGGSGFIGSHSIVQLLAAGHQVRTTVRSLKREGEVRAMLQEGGAVPGDRLSFITADLGKDEGWPEAIAGCEYVLHVASPLHLNIPKNQDELIVPAREGALRVLCASREAGVKRVVLTSSFAAVGYAQKPQIAPFEETNWTDPNGDFLPYVKSKTIGTAPDGRYHARLPTALFRHRRCAGRRRIAHSRYDSSRCQGRTLPAILCRFLTSPGS